MYSIKCQDSAARRIIDSFIDSDGHTSIWKIDFYLKTENTIIFCILKIILKIFLLFPISFKKYFEEFKIIFPNSCPKYFFKVSLKDKVYKPSAKISILML